MDMTIAYEEFSELIDKCGSIEEVQQHKKTNPAIAMRNEFWKQRKIALRTADPLEKQKALAKLQWLQQFFGSRIPILRAINQFTAPEGLYGIFISAKSSLGTGCVIFQHVSIGSNTLPDSPNGGFPIVGNNVYIGAGAKIIGNVIVGDHVRIAPNCCVTTDIPSNSIVTGDKIYISQEETPVINDYLTPEQFLTKRFSTVIYDYDEHTNDAELYLERATPGDLEAILSFYKDRMMWFRWKKIAQWGHYLQKHTPEEFIQQIESGNYYLVKKGTTSIAGFVLSEDSEQWMDEESNAYYLCRVASKVGYKNLGKFIASEAKKLTKAAGKDFLRLECIYANQQLNDIWENLGFAFVRDVEIRYHSALREWDARELS